MQEKKGISLIVLVITIIVMIVLAGAIILSLNNAGIIGNANKAVSDSDMATVKTAADLAYAEYLINNSEVDKDELQSWLNEKVDYEGYNVYVVKDETVVTKEGSLADKFYKGEIKVGDYVNYKASEEEKTFDATDYKYVSETNPAQDRVIQFKVIPEEKWRVLGVDSQTNEVLLTSETLVKAIDKSTNTETLFNISGFYGWVHGGALLDSICSEFGKGRYATKGRSITEDDIIFLFNYDRTQYRDELYVGKYGEKTTFGKNGVDEVFHPILDENNNYVFNENRVPQTEKSIITITNTGYAMVAEDVKERNLAAYDLIFNFNAGETYFLNSKYTSWGQYNNNKYDYISYGWLAAGVKSDGKKLLGFAESASAYNSLVWDSDNKRYIRPVVHIDANVGAIKDTVTGVWMLK